MSIRLCLCSYNFINMKIMMNVTRDVCISSTTTSTVSVVQLSNFSMFSS